MLFIENSPYLKGAPQYLVPEAGRQYIAMQNAVTEILGYHLPINEGIRSRADQSAKLAAWQAYRSGRGPWAPLAASPLFTSNHDEARQGAADIGGPGGRAMSAGERAVLDSVCRPYGWQGNRVPGEPWHYEYVGSPTLVSAETEIRQAPISKTLLPAVLTLIEGADTMPAPDLFHVVTTTGDQQYIADTDYTSVALGADDLAALEKAYTKRRVQINEYDRDAVVRTRAVNTAAFEAAVRKAVGK